VYPNTALLNASHIYQDISIWVVEGNDPAYKLNNSDTMARWKVDMKFIGINGLVWDTIQSTTFWQRRKPVNLDELWDDDAYFAIIRPNGQPLRLEINDKFDTIRTVLEEIIRRLAKVIQDLHASCQWNGTTTVMATAIELL
jgi:hypothetical protein